MESTRWLSRDLLTALKLRVRFIRKSGELVEELIIIVVGK